MEHSVDAMLSSSPDLASKAPQEESFMGGSVDETDMEAAAAGSNIHTQLRSRDGDGTMWVQFESAGAAQQTLRGAAIVQRLAGVDGQHKKL